MHLKIKVVDGPHIGAEFHFEEQASFVVGRHRRTQFRLPLKDKHLSRFHFFVDVKPHGCTLVDLKSSNHTFVNGKRVERIELNHGDEIRAGRTKLKVDIDAAAGRPPRPLPEEALPPIIPNYQLERMLGTGSCGVVYLASDTRNGARVALKILSPVIAGCPKSSAMFEREASLLRQLDHPHIVDLYEVGRVDNRLFMVMEFVPGLDALHLVKDRGGRLPIERAVDIARQALDALGHAHEAGIVHRDVKPNNLLLARINNRDVVKIGDFGLARLYRSSSLGELTAIDDIRGTLGFLPPEQIVDFHNVGPTADQYGVAATLYFLLTGAFPYNLAADDEECLRMILEDRTIPIRDRRPDLPESLALVVDQALSSDPADRFPNVQALHAELAPWSTLG